MTGAAASFCPRAVSGLPLAAGTDLNPPAGNGGGFSVWQGGA